MAAADLRAELSCSVCREIYTDPVTLLCGHNFCLICIERTWDWQKSIEEDPSCPECRRTYRRKPELIRNLRLRNIAEQFLSTDPQQDGTGTSRDSKCSSHNKILEYYCCEDGVCVCGSCVAFGEHRGHKVELLSEASDQMKEKLREVVEKLRPEREETERGAQRLQERRREVAEKAAGETERVTALFRDIREQLEVLEKRLLSDISSQKEKLSLTLTDLMEQLEIKKDELSRKIRHIEELCNMADPLTVLQERESHGAADNEGGRERHDIKVPAVGDLDVDLISETLLTGLAAIGTGVKGRIYGQEATDLLLDINTAHNLVSVSGDRKSASYSRTDQCHPQTPERFQVPQTLSSRSFPSGRHYWEVEVSESGEWRVGVAYPSIERRGDQSCIGDNNKSWCLYRWDDNYSVIHDNKCTDLPHVSSCRRIRISLDYEAGRLSFYELSEPIRHLHTFTATFTEPLHAAFWVVNAWVRIIS
ncbi:E3 ubiquitin/ISG15 ligase TRIM25-like [Xenopus laevis]|uniref:E3 ubiquitin/ISG15 ligase TRIM25-like n=1 Tax=Xenopus laevis TaxID=8355 RepID=A0A8J1LKZ4_XENLA|nr:E3 ubiquitin/ISG15 ligase TRIM25-like [Xenopus laevis]